MLMSSRARTNTKCVEYTVNVFKCKGSKYIYRYIKTLSVFVISVFTMNCTKRWWYDNCLSITFSLKRDYCWSQSKQVRNKRFFREIFVFVYQILQYFFFW